MTRFCATLMAAFGMLLGVIAPAAAQSFPTKPIHLVVPYAAGTETDLLARRLAAAMGARLKQNVLVDNKGGASGMIGASYVAKAPADGYTLLFGTSQTQSIDSSLFRSVPYKPLEDFKSIGRMFVVGDVLLVKSSLPVNSVEELVAYAKAHPGQVNYASTGVGTNSHLPGALLSTLTGANLTHVAYSTTGQMLSGLIGGEITMLFYPPESVKGFVDSGVLKPLAWTGRERAPQFPKVPTMIESGYADFVFGAWYGVLAPAGTPAAVADILTATLSSVANDPDFVKEASASGATLIYAPPAQFDAFIQSETKRFAAVISAIGIQPE